MVLEALDPDQGGLASGTPEDVWQNLSDRGIALDLPSVRRTLETLVASRRVERVEREGEEPVYTRPEVLLRAMGVLKPSARRPRT